MIKLYGTSLFDINTWRGLERLPTYESHSTPEQANAVIALTCSRDSPRLIHHPTAEKVFWEELMARHYFIHRGYGKRSALSGKGDLTVDDLRSWREIQKIRQTGDTDTTIRWGIHPKKKHYNALTVFDFDLHKIKDQEAREHLYGAIIRFAFSANLTLVRSLNGGLHLYCDQNPDEANTTQTTQSRILRCLATDVDILTGTSGVTGPDKNRTILHLSSLWVDHILQDQVKLPDCQYPPGWLLPLANTGLKDRAIAATTDNFLDSWKQGHRQRTLLWILRQVSLTDSEICELNQLFCLPPKEEDELNKEVLQNRPKVRIQDPKFEPEGYNWSNYAYKAHVYFRFDEDAYIWRPLEESRFLQYLRRDGQIPDEVLCKYQRQILMHIRALEVPHDFTDNLINKEGMVLRFKNKRFKIPDAGLSLEETDMNEARADFDTTEFPIEVETEAFKELSDQIDKMMIDAYTPCSFRNGIREFLPKTLQFLKSKFDYKSDELCEEMALVLIRIKLILLLKNFPQFRDLNPEKAIYLQGRGGSGKTTVANLLASCVLGDRIFTGDLSDSASGRFETGFMRDKSLLYFADENTSGLIKGTAGKARKLIKNLTGRDKIRYEQKYAGVGDFVNHGLVLITSNTERRFYSSADFASMKRRELIFIMNKTIKNDDQLADLDKSLLAEELLPAILLALKLRSQADQLVKSVKVWDSEMKLLQYNEHRFYDTEVDPITAFLECCVTTTRGEHLTPIRDLMTLYYQYILYRPGSSISSPREAALVRQLKKFSADFSIPASEYNTLFRLQATFLREEFKEPESEFRNALDTRLAFLPTNLRLRWTYEEFNYTTADGEHETAYQLALKGLKLKDIPALGLRKPIQEPRGVLPTEKPMANTIANLNNRRQFTTMTNNTTFGAKNLIKQMQLALGSSESLVKQKEFSTVIKAWEGSLEEAQLALEQRVENARLDQTLLLGKAEINALFKELVPPSWEESMLEILLNETYRQATAWKDGWSYKGFLIVLSNLMQQYLNWFMEEEAERAVEYHAWLSPKTKFKPENVRKSFLLAILKGLIENGNLTLDQVKWRNKEGQKTVKYVLLVEGLKRNSLMAIAKELFKKPMVIQPKDWQLDSERGLWGGGYYMAKALKLRAYANTPLINIRSKFSNEYKERINRLQKIPYWVDFTLVNEAAKAITDHLAEKAKECNEKKWSKEEEWWEQEKRYRERSEIVTNFNKLMLELLVLKELKEQFSPNSNVLKLYLPLHIDRVGRMYQQGILNVVGSKFFRRVLVPNPSETVDHECAQAQLEKHVKPNEILSSINKDYPSWEYRQRIVSMIGKPRLIFLDATSNMLQIYALLFADFRIAELANLGAGDKRDTIKEIQEGWGRPPEVRESLLLNERKFVKLIVMLTLYGSQSWGLISSLFREFDKDLNDRNHHNQFWRLRRLVSWAQERLKRDFAGLYKLRDAVRRRKSPNIQLNWQGNKHTYHFYQHKKLQLVINKAISDEMVQGRKRIQLEIKDETVKDMRRTNRTINTGLIHSIDATIAARLRDTMKQKYNTNVYSIHDCFGVEASKIEILLYEYKRILFQEAFDKCPYQVFGVTSKEAAVLAERKRDPKWKELREAPSPYCLKAE